MVPIFRSLIAPSLRVAIQTEVAGHLKALDPDIAEIMRNRMGPSLVYREAADWASFEQYETRKAIADSTALGSELKLALAMYEDMCSVVSEVIIERIAQGNVSRKKSPSEPCSVYALRLLEADIYVTKAHLHHKLRDAAILKATIERVLDDRLLDCYRALHCDFTQQPGTLRWITYLVSMAVLDSDLQNLPLRCVDLRRTTKFAQKPKYMVGWLDVKALSQTDEAFRARIHALQRARGLPFTWFGEFDEKMGRLGL